MRIPLTLLDEIPLSLLLIAALTLGLAPFFPQPHIAEKIHMLLSGTLAKPLDIFDFLLHGLPFGVLAAKLARMVHRRYSLRR